MFNKLKCKKCGAILNIDNLPNSLDIMVDVECKKCCNSKVVKDDDKKS